MKIALLFYHSVYDDEIRGLLDTLECARYVKERTHLAIIPSETFVQGKGSGRISRHTIL